MSGSLSLETKLDRVADDLVGVIQSLRLMSHMQRQQGEQLDQILTLLTPEETKPRADLGALLANLVVATQQNAFEVHQLDATLRQMSESLPARIATAVVDALARANPQGPRR